MSSSIPHAAVVEQKVRLSHTPRFLGTDICFPTDRQIWISFWGLVLNLLGTHVKRAYLHTIHAANLHLLTVSEIYQGHTASYFPDQTQTHWGQLLSHTPEVEQREPEDDNASSRFHVSFKRWVRVYLDNRLYYTYI